MSLTPISQSQIDRMKRSWNNRKERIQPLIEQYPDLPLGKKADEIFNTLIDFSCAKQGVQPEKVHKVDMETALYVFEQTRELDKHMPHETSRTFMGRVIGPAMQIFRQTTGKQNCISHLATEGPGHALTSRA